MKFHALYIFLLCYCCIGYSQNTRTILNTWQFRQAGTMKWMEAQVPGTVHTDLLNNGIIEDPFYRLNENEVQWVDKVNWEYQTIFTLTPQMKEAEQLILFFGGLDTYADVYLNDRLILEVDNMFVAREVVIDSNMLEKDNYLRIYFHSPIVRGLSLLEAHGMALPADNDQSEKGGLGNNKVSVFTRKPGYHYGWDWGPRLVTSGIWRDVYLIAKGPLLVKDFYINQQGLTSSNARILVSFDLSSSVIEKISLSIKVNGNEVSNTKHVILDTLSSLEIPVNIDNPRLWWPNGHGDPYLYKISAEIAINGKVVEYKEGDFGVRTIELVRKSDKSGESFYFNVNGKAIFVKGSNYIPNDVFLPRVSNEKYEHIISSAAMANMNMLRVWGGGIYENDVFYDLCDKYGIMVWQDFMFADAMYPSSDEFYNSVKKEAIYNIKRLRNHPCIALWCGNNEIEVAWANWQEDKGRGWKQKYTQFERFMIWNGYDTIFNHILNDQVKKYNYGTGYWPSSPSTGSDEVASHDNISGDMHYWGVWHGGEPVKSFANYKSRFMSEYGFHSYPEFESIKKYTEFFDWNNSSQVMLAHQRSLIGNQKIDDYMSQSYYVPVNFEDHLYVGQLLQAEAIKLAIESHRSKMPYCMGSLYCQLNDCWPGASCSSIDYYGRWKALHYYVKEAFKNQILVIKPEGNYLKIYGVSDTESVTGSLRISLMDFEGKSIWNRTLNVSLPSNGSKVLTTISLDKLPALKHSKDALLFVSLVKNEKILDSDVYYFDEPKNLKLPHPDLTMHIRQKGEIYYIEITSNKLCKNLMLISEGNSYSFSENFFDLLPNETRVIKVDSKLSFDEFQRKLSYIHLQQTLH